MGCGWGSLSLANAAAFPKLKFTSFSNSKTQIESIREMAKERGLSNLTVHVEDYADFCTVKSKVRKLHLACADHASCLLPSLLL